MNRITFTFNSEANWSENELDELNSILADKIREVDEDAVEGSYDTVCRPTGNDPTPAISEAVKNQVIEEFMDDAKITAKMTLTSGGFGMDIHLS